MLSEISTLASIIQVSALPQCITPTLTKLAKSDSESLCSSITMTQTDPACPRGLCSLPVELLSEIMTFAMASDTPVYFWLYLKYSRNSMIREAETARLRSRQSCISSPVWMEMMPQNQKKHYSDWRAATSTCRGLKKSAISAFFRHKSFVIPPWMLAELRDGKVPSSSFDMAVESIENVVVPIYNLTRSTDFIALPKYHHFRKLKILTFDGGFNMMDVMNGEQYDTSRKDYIAPSPVQPPQEFLNLLALLGLRLDQIEFRFLLRIKDESGAQSMFRTIEKNVYPFLHVLIQRRAKASDRSV